MMTKAWKFEHSDGSTELAIEYDEGDNGIVLVHESGLETEELTELPAMSGWVQIYPMES